MYILQVTTAKKEFKIYLVPVWQDCWMLKIMWPIVMELYPVYIIHMCKYVKESGKCSNNFSLSKYTHKISFAFQMRCT